MDTKISGRVGVSVLCYYVGTTLIAVTEGFVFIYAMRPVFGAKSENQTRTQVTGDVFQTACMGILISFLIIHYTVYLT